MEPPAPFDVPVSELELSPRAHRAIAYYHCLTLMDITRLTRRDLLAVRHVGPRAVNEIREALSRHFLDIEMLTCPLCHRPFGTGNDPADPSFCWMREFPESVPAQMSCQFNRRE